MGNESYYFHKEATRIVETTVAFTGTDNTNGDYDGTGNPSTIFTVTGTVLMRLYALCTVDFAGAMATLEIGTAKNTAGIIAQATATDIDINELWHDASPDASVELATVVPEKIVNEDVIATVGTANITAGTLKFICEWRPISKNAKVEVA